MSLQAPRWNTILNVTNFSNNITNDKLYEMFAKFGTVKSCKIMNEHCPAYLRFAYVAFEDPDEAEDAIIEMNGQQISGEYDQRLRVQRTHKKYPSRAKREWEKKTAPARDNKSNYPNDGLTIYVRNLDEVIDSACLRCIFECFGTISSAKVIIENGRSKGYGFVTFSRPEEAAQAVKEKNSSILLGTKRIHVAFARGKNPNRNPAGSSSTEQPSTSHLRLTTEETERNEQLVNYCINLVGDYRLSDSSSDEYEL